MKSCYFSLLFVFSFQIMSAQTLIPFLGKNGKYGFANESGKIVIPPEFEGRMELFGPSDLYKDFKKNGAGIRLFRNGVKVPNPHLNMGRALRCVDVDSRNSRTDTLTDLVVCPQNDRLIFVDLTTGQTVETFNESYLNNLSDWKKGEDNTGISGLVFRFSDGIARVFSSNGSVNFLSKKLTFLLSKDVAGGWILDEQYLAAADFEGQFGVLDRRGGEALPKKFRHIETAGRTGVFIVNNHRYELARNTGAGLYAAGDQVLLDTIFERINPAPGGRFVVAQKEHRFGIYALDGREIVAPEATRIENYNGDTRPLAITWKTDSRANILDATGKMHFSTDVQSVRGVTSAGSIFPHFIVADGSKKMVLDTALNLVLEVETDDLSLASSTPELLFFAKKSKASSLLRRDGSVLYTGDFDGVSLESFLTEKRLVLLQKGDRQGLASHDGHMVLPFEFEEFRMETRARDTVLWARPSGSRLFFEYDLLGKKRSEFGRTYPDSRSDNPITTGQTMSDGRKKMTLFNGLEVIAPDSLKDLRLLTAWWDGRDRAIMAFGKDNEPAARAVFNEKFDPILPSGFVAPNKLLGENLFQRIMEHGLIVVKERLPSPPIVSPKPSLPKTTLQQSPASQKKEVPTKNNEPERIVMYDMGVEEAPREVDRNYGETPYSFDKNGPCGLIDVGGNWLIEPKTGVDLLPLSPFVVAEMPVGERNANHNFFEKGIRLHVVGGELKGKVIEANWLGQDGFSHENMRTMKVGRLRKGTPGLAEYAYIDWQGREITDWIFENGPDFLKSKNLVHIWEKDILRVRQAVIDRNGEILFELGDLMTDDPPHKRSSNWNLTYLTVHERKIGDKLPEGLMDSTGRLVLPLEFLDLAVWEKDRFLTSKTMAGNAVLMTIEGRKIHEFGPSKSNILMQKIGRDHKGEPVGPVAVWTQNETILMDESNEVLRHFDLPFGREVLPEEMAEQFVVLIKNNQKVWADYRSGKLFFE